MPDPLIHWKGRGSEWGGPFGMQLRLRPSKEEEAARIAALVVAKVTAPMPKPKLHLVQTGAGKKERS